MLSAMTEPPIKPGMLNQKMVMSGSSALRKA